MVEAAVYATRTYGGVRGVKPYSISAKVKDHLPCLHAVRVAGLQPVFMTE